MTELQQSENPPRSKQRSRPAVYRGGSSYDALARRLQITGERLYDGKVPLAIGLTSCLPHEGVTTVAANLALAAARVSSGPILVVDANSARPAVHKAFGVRAPLSGLLNVLIGEIEPFECTVDCRIDNLKLLCSGRLPQDRVPAYDGPSIEEMLDSLKHVFPLIVFDLAPATEMTPCCALAGKLDGVVLVVEANRVHRDAARRSKQLLLDAQAKIMGAVFNRGK